MSSYSEENSFSDDSTIADYDLKYVSALNPSNNHY